VLQNGDLVAGGDFPSGGIARWNGVSWVAMGSGVGGTPSIVRSLAVLPNGDLVAGGNFATAGGLASPCVARWSGSAWSSMCSTITNVNTPGVSATLALPNGDLVIAGSFTGIDGVAANNLARWSNGAWTPFGMGLGSAGGIQSLARLPNGDLVAGGPSLLGGATMARWNGSVWSPFADSPNFSVFGLTVLPNGDLVAAGDFTAIGTVPALGVARWDGTNWSQLASGAGALGGGNLDVLAAVSMPNGDLVVGGRFTTIGGILAQRIARWNGSTWSSIGAGLPGEVWCLGVLPNGDLLAGGLGGVFLWSGGNWSTLLALSTVTRLTVLANGDVWVAGGAGWILAAVVEWNDLVDDPLLGLARECDHPTAERRRGDRRVVQLGRWRARQPHRPLGRRHVVGVRRRHERGRGFVGADAGRQPRGGRDLQPRRRHRRRSGRPLGWGDVVPARHALRRASGCCCRCRTATCWRAEGPPSAGSRSSIVGTARPGAPSVPAATTRSTACWRARTARSSCTARS
jgi:hypothetical protein